jgi:hypothetical protein
MPQVRSLCLRSAGYSIEIQGASQVFDTHADVIHATDFNRAWPFYLRLPVCTQSLNPAGRAIPTPFSGLPYY